MADYNIRLGVEVDTSNIQSQINRIRNPQVTVDARLNVGSIQRQINRDVRANPILIDARLNTSNIQTQINSIRQQLQQLGNININLGAVNGGNGGGRGARGQIDDTARAYRELISLQNRIGSKQQRIAILDTSENQREILELSSQIENLLSRYQQIRSLFNGRFNNTQLDGLNRGFQIAGENLDAVQAKIADARAELARGINIELGNGGFNKQIVNIEAEISKLLNVSDDVQTAMNNVRLAFTDMQTASASGDINALIAANERYIESLKTVKNQLDINKVSNNSDVEQQTRAYRELLSISKEISSLEINIAKLKGQGGNTNQISVLEGQLRTLQATYQQLVTSMNTPLTSDQWSSIYTQIAQTSESISKVQAKIADARAELARGIELKLNNGTFDNDVSNITSKFDKLTDKSGIVRNAMNEVSTALSSMRTAAASGDIEGLIAANEKYERSLKEVKNQLDINARAERDAASIQKLANDRSAFQSKIDTWLTKNSAATNRFGAAMMQLRAQAESCDRITLGNLHAEFSRLDAEAGRAGLKMQSFGDRIKTQFQKYSQYFSVASVIMWTTRGLKDMFKQVVSIDTAMTELKKVTNESNASYNKFLDNAASRAKEIGTTIDGLVGSTADFARLGYSFEQSAGLAEVANIYAVVGDEIDGVEGATQSLVSTMAAFKSEMGDMSDSDFAMSIVDKFNEVSNNFAISSGGIGEAMERSASSLRAANNTIDESIAMITAANEVTQNPEKVGKWLCRLKKWLYRLNS